MGGLPLEAMVVSNSHSKLIKNQSGTLGEWQQLHKYAGNWRTDKELTHGLNQAQESLYFWTQGPVNTYLQI